PDSGRAVKRGAAATISEKLAFAEFPSVSITEIVMAAVPNRPGAGYRVTERSNPSPRKTMSESAKRLRSEELAVSFNAVAGVSKSATVNKMGSLELPLTRI